MCVCDCVFVDMRGHTLALFVCVCVCVCVGMPGRKRRVSADDNLDAKETPARRRTTFKTFKSPIFNNQMAKTAMNYVNPVYIAEKLNPLSKRVGRLFKPVIAQPIQQVNWVRNKLTWRNMQGPLSAIAAVVLGGLCAVLSQQSTGIALSPASVISITTIVMEMGSTERFYVRSALRMLGTVIGALVGFGIAAIGIGISDGTTNYVALQAFLLCMVAVGGFITFMGMKFFEETAYAFMMFGVTMFSVMYTGGSDWTPAITAMLSALTGVMVSIFTILLFQFPKADLLLAETHKKAVENLFTLVKFAIELDPRSVDDFSESAKQVRSALVSTGASHEIYSQWRKWTQRDVDHNFDSLSVATRPIYYLSYSMFWSLVQSPSAHACGGRFFFCDSPIVYEKYFQSTKLRLEGSMMAIEASLSRILVRDKKDTCPPQQHMDMIVSRHLWSGCVRNIHILKEAYIEHRDEAYSHFGQHWSVCDYLHEVIALTMAICAYVHAIAETFLPDMAVHIYPMLEDICENLTQIRNEGNMRSLHVLPSREHSTHTDLSSHSVTPVLSANTSMEAHMINRMPRSVQVDEDTSDEPPNYPGTLNRYYMQHRQRQRDDPFRARESP